MSGVRCVCTVRGVCACLSLYVYQIVVVVVVVIALLVPLLRQFSSTPSRVCVCVCRNNASKTFLRYNEKRRSIHYYSEAM